MYRRRRPRNGIDGMKTDPAKDLFAYLFLMIMVFCFMLMMATHDIVNDLAGNRDSNKAPKKAENTAGTALTRMAESDLGRLVKKQNDIFIAYGNRLYSPARDMESLRADGRIRFMKNKGNTEKQVLYLEDYPDQQVLLAEYLEAFGHLSRQGIGVAFAERIHD